MYHSVELVPVRLGSGQLEPLAVGLVHPPPVHVLVHLDRLAGVQGGAQVTEGLQQRTLAKL